MNTKSLTLLALAMLSAPALAQTGGSTSTANPPGVLGFYVGGSIGRADYNLGGATDDKDTAWKVFGGYEFNRMFGVELAWVDLGEVTSAGGGFSGSAETDGVQLSAIVNFPIPLGPMSALGIFGKLGTIRADTSGTICGAAGCVSADDDNWEMTYGLGLKYEFTPNMAVRGEWERFNDIGDDLDLWTVGVQFKF